jgi:hypothetical protein
MHTLPLETDFLNSMRPDDVPIVLQLGIAEALNQQNFVQVGEHSRFQFPHDQVQIQHKRLQRCLRPKTFQGVDDQGHVFLIQFKQLEMQIIEIF